jgi:GTP-binding protein HflX
VNWNLVFFARSVKTEEVLGNIGGLKKLELQTLGRIYRRKMPVQNVITPELGKYMSEISRQIQRQVGILIDRAGRIKYVIVGSNNRLMLPDIGRSRAGKSRFRGLRLVHTHLKESPLSYDDLMDLTLLRFDLVCAIVAGENGMPGSIYLAHISPGSNNENNWIYYDYRNIHDMDFNFQKVIQSLEEEVSKVRHGHSVDDKKEQMILVGISVNRNTDLEESMDELQKLAESAGVVVVDRITQVNPKLNPTYLIGEGKLKQVILASLLKGADGIIFNTLLSPSQCRNIAKISDLKILDRNQLILDIFSQRATTHDGKLQVELARLKYHLPRLSALDDSMSRLTGGIGARGPGETKLEESRRRIHQRINRLEKEIQDLSRKRQVKRSMRQRKGLPVVSIIGYTNSGKSTLLNTLTKSHVFVKDQVFATLDPTSRRLRFPRERDIIITDTVGFIRDLPGDLKDAFRATLEELHHADLFLHVIDTSAKNFLAQMNAVEEILAELKLEKTNILKVFNKIDLTAPEVVHDALKRFHGIPVSAIDETTFSPLLVAMEKELFSA